VKIKDAQLKKFFSEKSTKPTKDTTSKKISKPKKLLKPIRKSSKLKSKNSVHPVGSPPPKSLGLKRSIS